MQTCSSEIKIPKTAKKAEPTYYAILEISETAGKSEIKYDRSLAESKEGGLKDIYFTPKQTSTVPASGEQCLLLREKTSLSDLMKKAGEINRRDLILMLQKADAETVVKLLDSDELLEELYLNRSQLSGRLYLIDFATVDFSPIIRHKILTEKRLYTRCGTYVICRFAECSPEDCCMILSNPVLNKNLNGKDLFDLSQKFSIKIENFDTDVQEKYKAYCDLLSYEYVSGSDVGKEKEKIEFWIKKAQVEESDIGYKKFKNTAVKKMLDSNIYELDYMDLYELADTDSVIATKIGNDLVLWRKFTIDELGIFYLFLLSKKYINVCTSFLQNFEIIKFLNGEDLFRLREQYAGELTVYSAIESNLEANKKYNAYYQLLNYPSTDETVPDEKTEEHILELYRETGVSSAHFSFKNRTLALVFLKHNLVYLKSVVIANQPSLSYYLIDNHVIFYKAFEDGVLLNSMIGISENICLKVLGITLLAGNLNGEQLDRISKGYSREVLDKIIKNTVLLDRYHAYKKLIKLIQQPGIKVDREEKKFNSTASVSVDINEDYERAIFLQEEGHLSAFDYFDKAVKAGYEPAIDAIKKFPTSIIDKIKRYSLDDIKKCVLIADVFLDPKKLYYDEEIAIAIYKRITDYWGPALCLEVRRAYYVLGRHYLGSERNYYAEFCFGRLIRMMSEKESYKPLLEECWEDISKRRTIKKEQKKQDETVKEDLSREPAIQFILGEIKTEPKETQAESYIELFRSFFEKGYIDQAQSYLAKAIDIDATNLTVKDWVCLGDLQRSKVLHNFKDQKACNECLTSYLHAVQMKESPGQIADFIGILCEKNVDIIPGNVEMILSLPELLEKLELNVLYTILEKNSLTAPILPGIRESKGLDEGQEDYLDTLVAWAADKDKLSLKLSQIPEAKSLESELDDHSTALTAWVSEKNKNLSKLSTLAEVFLNGRNGEQASYQKYVQKCLEEIIYLEEIARKALDASKKVEESKSVTPDADDTITQLIKKISTQSDSTKKIPILLAICQEKCWKKYIDLIVEKEIADIEEVCSSAEEKFEELPTTIAVKTYHHRWLPSFAIIINLLLASAAVLLFFLCAQLFVSTLIVLLIIDILLAGHQLTQDSMTVNEVPLDQLSLPLLLFPEGSTTSELFSSLPRSRNNEGETDEQTLTSVSSLELPAARQLVEENNNDEGQRVDGACQLSQ